MDYIFEFLLALILTWIFYREEKPKIKFLAFGYVFFIVSLLLQFPLVLLQYYLTKHFNYSLMPQILIGPLIIVISELTKYFSMKRFLKTKSFKNGVFFGIGWTSLESINFITVTFFSLAFSFFSLNIGTVGLVSQNYSLVNFIMLLTTNLAITVFVINSIIKKKYFYLALAILYSLVFYYGLLLYSGLDRILFMSILFLISLYVLFKYRNFK